MRQIPTDQCWLALYTKGRHEKFIYNQLIRKRIEAFLPTRTIKRRWSDRTVSIEEPLFKSYLFVRTAYPETGEVLRTQGAVKFVSVQGAPIPINEKVIASIKSFMVHDMAVDPFPYLMTGDRVIVCQGIFKGIEGFISRKDSKRCRLVISIDALMASVSVEIDSGLVEKV